MTAADPNDYQIPTPIGGALPVAHTYSTIEAERRHRKLKLAAAYRLLARFGLTEGIAGHVTARDPEHHDRYWVNRYAQHFSTVHPDDLICIDDDGRVHHGDGPVNAAAVAIHCGIHGTIASAVAAVHTHTTYGRAFAARERLLAPINQEACLFFENHVVFRGDVVVLATDEGRRIAQAMGDCKAAILLNHGLLTIGSSVDSAVYRFIAMERCAQVQLLAEAAGPIEVLGDEEARGIRRHLASDYVAWLGFQGLYEQLLREHADLRAYAEAIAL
ncbi:class II aldolase/adducin family protein [Burkholderia gladioli]|uniref:Class II aldolase/adducin family protein n=1 Tax=Burkholderia gladioli TaxID=28095 RepID=A0A2A7SGW9_BURGA|nr:class II aldolase/adducin family protein [Burkholderia gladioli]MBU9426952.1 class II aldolase/adducin family protein [Burkholderia gladioli]MBU9640532.1 class II aldolase/adducin family protein [Burkholderia gladioli]MDN8061015.1 class II aldolase/adducin family protein [Burkholderia gladioli]PEH42669.1 class II aldolase/adducin family protein [Burkholderia gladioli]QPQ86752.1 class II aldolase/adducin family protein [Burkholderia gladioli]